MRRGYTLIEVLVVVTCLGIAGALVVPSLGSVNVLRIQAAVRAVVADVTYAQADAMAYQEPRAVLFDEETNSYALLAVPGQDLDPELGVLYDSHGRRWTVSLDGERYGRVRLANAGFGGENAIIFDQLGGPVAAPGSDEPGMGGSVDIVGPLSTFRISVAPFTGRVTVRELTAEEAAEMGVGAEVAFAD